MNPWFAKAAVLAASTGLLLLPALAHRRDGAPRGPPRGKGRGDRILLAITGIGFLLPLLWVATRVLEFADHALRPAAFAGGIPCLAAGLWLLYRSHADLGSSWSITLELHAGHALVTRGVYRRVRHPMYAALLCYACGQALLLPNWFAGPAYLVAIALMVAFRLGPEERMMREAFGEDYVRYAARTRRLVPGLW